MKIIFGYKEKELKKMKDEWNINKSLITAPAIDKDKLITLMKDNLNKIFTLLEMD